MLQFEVEGSCVFVYSIFRNLAIIILSAKFFALVARKCKAPQVVGEIIAGLLIGPCVFNLVQNNDTISVFAEIGVVLLMFSTGLGTNLKELMKAGPIATLIACVGVAVPLAGGTALYGAFYGFGAIGSVEFYRALFIGTIMTATSVSITVATLQEMGHLKSFLGTTIVSAAVIDDVIGIVVLTCVIGASSGTGIGLGQVLVNTLLFFVVAIVVGVIIHYAMQWLDKRDPHPQRITIVSIAFCFALAYVAFTMGATWLLSAPRYLAGCFVLPCAAALCCQKRRWVWLCWLAAQAAVAAWGYDYPVSVRLEETWFPTRQYQGAALPAGDYLALRVLIGAAAGHNWWCVVFPPLCLPAVSEAAQPAAALTRENYALITEEDAGYTFRFHLVEWWEGLKHWLAEE